MQTVPVEDTAKLVNVIERFDNRVLGIRKIVIQEFFAVAKRPSKQSGFTDIKLQDGSVRTIATGFLRFKRLCDGNDICRTNK